MEDRFPWIYVAMIFIAFVSWVINRVQENSAARRARETAWEEEEEEEGYHPPAREAGAAPQRTQSPPSRTEPGPPQSFGDVFRELERQMAEAKRQREEESSPFPSPARAPQPPTPPPLPPAARTSAAPSAQRSGAPKGKTPPVTPSSAPPFQPAAGAVPHSARTARLVESRRRAYAGKRGTRDTSDALSRMLRDRSNLRVAFLLKEILDEPLALRSAPVRGQRQGR